MIKRLSISLLLMGLAVFSLGAAAFAWFSTSETGNVTISTGSADISIDVDIDCDTAPSEYPDGTVDGEPFAFSWTGIVPGDSTKDCFSINNTGDGTLDVYVQHTSWAGAALLDSLLFTYDDNDSPGDGDWCGPGNADDAVFTANNDNRGCFIGTVAPGTSIPLEARVLFPETGDTQDNLQDRSFSLTSVITGYTG